MTEILTKKFSEFIAGSLDATNQTVGLSAGANARFSSVTTWTTAGRPTTPTNGLLGYNSTLGQYEFYDNVLMQWTQLEDSTDIATLLALLASHTAGEGASLIGLEDQGAVVSKTVQDMADATFIVKTDNGSLANAQVLGALATGVMATTNVTGVVATRILTGTANQIDIANGDGSGNPTYSLSATLDLPGTYTVQSSTVIDEIIDDDTMATATDSNLATAESIVAYIATAGGAFLPLAGGTMTGSILMSDSTIISSTTTLADTYAIAGYDTGLTTNVDFVRITVGNPVTFDINTSTTIGTAYIYRVGGTDVALADGGTNASLVANEGGIFYSTATAGAILAGTATAGQILQSGATAAPAWSTATYPATSGAVSNVMTSDGTNWVSSSAAGIGSPLTTKGDIYTYSTTNDRLPVATGDGKVLQVSAGAATGLAYSTPTYPSASGSAGLILRSDGTNNVYSQATYPDLVAINSILFATAANTIGPIAPALSSVLISSAASTGVPAWSGALADGQLIIGSTGATPVVASLTAGANISITPGAGSISIAATGGAGSPLTTKGDIYAYSTTNDRFPVATGDGKVLQVNAAATFGIDYSTATFPSIATGTGTFLRADGTNWVASTTTIPDTFAISTIPYASSANVLSALASAQNGVLVSGNTNVPVMLAGPGTADNFLKSNAAAAPSWSSYTMPASDGANNQLLKTNGTGAIVFANTAQLLGTATNDDATAGNMGEYISSSILVGSAVSLTTGTPANLTAISLTAGDWDVWVQFASNPAGGTTSTAQLVGISQTSVTFPTVGAENNFSSNKATLGAGVSQVITAGPMRISLAGTTTIYAVIQMTFAVSTMTGYGFLGARRRR